MLNSLFVVPRLNTASVMAGGCCPVPAEALIVPELEAIPGVDEASADWQTAEVRVRHASTASGASVSHSCRRWR